MTYAPTELLAVYLETGERRKVGRLALMEKWRSVASGAAEASVFPSERGTPLSKHNVWRRNIQPKLKS